MPRKPNWKSLVIDRLIIIPKKYPHNILGTCIVKDKSSFYMREMKIFSSLLKKYPDEGFWKKALFPQKYESLCYFKSDYGKILIRNKYNEFKYKVPNKEVNYKIGERQVEIEEVERKPKTIKDFLDL